MGCHPVFGQGIGDVHRHHFGAAGAQGIYELYDFEWFDRFVFVYCLTV
jgi:hypothetical protein